jgi:hypothetical protein
MSVPCDCCVLSGRGLCDGLITCLEESNGMWRVQWVWSRSHVRGGYDPERGRSVTKKEEKFTKSQRLGQNVDCGNSSRHHTIRLTSQSTSDSCKSTEENPIFQQEFLKPFFSRSKYLWSHNKIIVTLFNVVLNLFQPNYKRTPLTCSVRRTSETYFVKLESLAFRALGICSYFSSP